MSKKTLAAGTSPFAHLLSSFRGKRAEDETPEDEEARKARRAEEDQRREEEDARRVEEDQRREEEDARRAEEDGNDPADPEPVDGRESADDDEQNPEADSSDDDDCGGMDDNASKAFRRGLALGRIRENARAARIFASPAAAGRADLAATLAFTTRNTSAEADRLMHAAGAPAGGEKSTLHRRMARVHIANPGPGDGKTGAKSEMDEFLSIAASARTKAGIA